MQIIAHRGYSSRAPENTMAAFEMAADAGCRALELDVHLSSDGHVMVIHDEKLKRTTNGDGLVSDCTGEELRQLDCGSWFGADFAGEKMPYLRDVLKLAKARDLWLNVELKNNIIRYNGLEQAVIDLIHRFSAVDQVSISSFNHYSLVSVKQILPEVETAILYMAGLYEPWNYARTVGAEALHPVYYSLTETVMVGIKSAGLKVRPFTVDDPQHIAAVAAAGVDGIITNYPERVQEQLNVRP